MAKVKRKTFTTRAKESSGLVIMTMALKAAFNSGEWETRRSGRSARITRKTLR